MKKAKAESRRNGCEATAGPATSRVERRGPAKRKPSRPLQKPEKVPSGWYTRRDLEEAWGLSDKRTGVLVSKAVRSGMAEHRTFRIETGLRGVYPTLHYRFKG
jgi:hypothetical protein